MITLAPLKCARQQNSRSSPKNEISRQKPSNSRNVSALISMQAELMKKTSFTESCCSWSRSFVSINGSTSPHRSINRPTDFKIVGLSHCTIFGPTTEAFDASISCTNWPIVDGCNTTSSCITQNKPRLPSTMRCVSFIRAPKPGFPSTIRTIDSGNTA